MVTLTRRKFTAHEYHEIAKAGVLGEDDRVELIEGEIVEMAPIGPRHANCVRHLNTLLSQMVMSRAIVDVQNPLNLGDRSEPQPDLALLRARSGLYPTAHPGPDDVLLVIEVADTSAAYDREMKLPLYARHGITEAWLVDLEANRVEVHREPGPDGYMDVTTHHAGGQLSLLALPDLSLAVDEIL